MSTNRAYSFLEVKAVDEDKRIIRGVATTPEPDRVGDIVEPLGVTFKNPIPLLHQHRSDQPVGTVRLDKPTKDGITFEARLPKIAEPGPLRDRVDTAWGEIKTGLIRAVSIGFRAIEYAFMEEGGGIRFLASEVLELSLVSVPANAGATITEIRSIDTAQRAASGLKRRTDGKRARPGASGSITLNAKDDPMPKSIPEQIAALEQTRATKAAAMNAVMQKSINEGRSTDQAEQEEFDTLNDEVEKLDGDIGRLKSLQKAMSAKPVEPKKAATPEGAADLRAGIVVKEQKKELPGIGFARIVRVKALAQLHNENARELAKSLYGENSDTFGFFVKTAVGGAVSSGTWAGNLIGDESGVVADFVEYLRAGTILGKFGSGGIPSLRRVPFRSALVGQTSGGDAYWTGEGKPKGLTKFDFSRTTLEPLKVANIAVVSKEVLRDSSPSAEVLVRDALIAALRERLDIDFIDPDKAASAGVSPASISNGITAESSSGNDADAIREDVKAAFAGYIAANNPPTTGVWIMSATTALALSLIMNPLGQSEFPGLTMMGGTFAGLPVIVSEYVPSDSNGHYVFLVNASDIYLADEGGVEVDMSREASLQMDDSPSTQDATTGTGTSLVSLWQTNMVGFLAERTINWARRRSSAVFVLDSVNWGVPTSS